LVIATIASLTWSFLAFFAEGSGHQKGTWIWETSKIVTDRENVLAFCKQNGVTDIYLYIDQQKVEPRDYALFIKEAREQQIQVEALGGDPSWGTKEKLKDVLEFVQWVESYNLNVQKEERFSGIHFDIEPYLLPDWVDDQDQVLKEWLMNMDRVAKQGIKVSIDLPYWSDQVMVPGYQDYSLSSWMLKRFDTVVLMDYRDTALGNDGIIANALDELREAASLNKSVIVGVEMAESGEGDKVTFYEEGVEAMEKELDITRQHLKSHSSFKGVAVHGFPAWISSYQKERGKSP